ncbi:MAG TPA: 30S ribosomal protein S1, partial [Bacteroidales bacterium]|nr:30S ribosomal protein S1 [Bacteroidales bacterium]
AVEDKLNFKVIEFNKGAKKIIVSHSRVFEDERKGSETASRRSEADNTKKAARKIKASLEKTTLGDITELQALKDEMEEKEAKSLGKKKK